MTRVYRYMLQDDEQLVTLDTELFIQYLYLLKQVRRCDPYTDPGG
jgi:hypothetical protein